MRSSKVLNRLKIDIIDNNDNQIFRVFEDWCKLVEMQKEIDIKPNRVEFEWLPGYTFYGLKQVSSEQEVMTDLSVTFKCDFFGFEIENLVDMNEIGLNENDNTFNFVCDKFINKKIK